MPKNWSQKIKSKYKYIWKICKFIIASHMHDFDKARIFPHTFNYFAYHGDELAFTMHSISFEFSFIILAIGKH